ncbi:hypothetical protein ACFQ9X_13495 [Catenulispora yoronensis]
MTLRRGHDTAHSEHLAAFAVRHSAHYRSLGLAGDESAHPATPYARAFAIAREGGLTAAPHAGELAGPESVRTAIEALGATRIAHGVRAATDPDLLTELVERGVSLDICPTSNIALGIVPSPDAHPLPQLLAAGVPCTLGTDDPLMFGASLLDEYETARTGLGLSDAQLAAVAGTSVMTSGAPAGWCGRRWWGSRLGCGLSAAAAPPSPQGPHIAGLDHPTRASAHEGPAPTAPGRGNQDR